MPVDMIRAFRAFIDFYYLVRKDSITEDTLDKIRNAVSRFHHFRQIFQSEGVRAKGPRGISLPRQHSLMHYVELIRDHASPNGLCTSITESKHITAVRKPYRRSSRYNALQQIITTNERLDKLARARADFTERGMLHGSCLLAALERASQDLAHHQLDTSEDNSTMDSDDNANSSNHSDNDSQDSDGHGTELGAGNSDLDREEEDTGDCGPDDTEVLCNEVRLVRSNGAWYHF